MVNSSKTRSKSKKPRATSASSGIALALTAFTVPIFLYFQPSYYGQATNGAAIALIVIGIMGLGVELEKISSGRRDNLTDQPKGAGIFNNLGMGLGFLVVWATIYYYFPIVWVNVITSVVLLFGVYGFILGILNWLFGISSKPSIRDKPTEEDRDRVVLVAAGNTDRIRKPWSLAMKIAIGISGLTAFVASLLQILQIVKVIP